MNKLTLLFAFLFMLVTSGTFAQLQLKIQQLNDGLTWGVFVKPCNNISPSGHTITGSGQVTIVVPSNAKCYDLVSLAGAWSSNAFVKAPKEAPGKAYFSVGFVSDMPQIIYQPGQETLLFSFKMSEGPFDEPKLIENGIDAFDKLPNSENTNPGNELSVIDFGKSPAGLYYYSGNYFPGDTDCNLVPPSEPQDSIVLSNLAEDENEPAAITSITDYFTGETWFTVSPNPAFDWIKIGFEKTTPEGQGTIRLWNSSGVPIGAIERGQRSNISVNVWELPAGIYFISFEDGGKVLQRARFIKQ